MKIEKTIYKSDLTISYIITDNICMMCANNHKIIMENPYKFGGMKKCQDCAESVTECYNFKKYK